MAQFQTYAPLQYITEIAGENIAKGLFVKKASGTAKICGAGGVAIGVSHYDCLQDQTVSIASYGVVLVLVGDGGVTEGTLVASGATGKAVAVAALSVTIPSDSTPVTSDGAQPTLVVAGGKLPVEALGIALDTATAGTYARVKLF